MLSKLFSTFLADDLPALPQGSEHFENLGAADVALAVPYITYHEEEKVFELARSFGFFFSFEPLQSMGVDTQHALSKALEDVLEQGDSVQVLTLADHRIDPLLKEWSLTEKERRRSMAAQLEREATIIAQESGLGMELVLLAIDFFRRGVAFDTFKSHHSVFCEKKESWYAFFGYRGLNLDFFADAEVRKKDLFKSIDTKGAPAPARDYRVIFSFSSPKKKKADLNSFCLKKKKLVKSFNAIIKGFEQAVGDANDLLDIAGCFFSYENSTKIYKRSYDPATPLNHQCTVPGGIIDIAKNQVFFSGTTEAIFRSYRSTEFPDKFTIDRTIRFFGGDDVNGIPITKQIQGSFFVHYGFQVCRQNKAKKQIFVKKFMTDWQSHFAKLSKYPFFQRTRAENEFIEMKKQEGQKIIYVDARLTFGIFSKDVQAADDNEQALKTLLGCAGFDTDGFFANNYKHFHEMLFSLPMTWADREKEAANYGSVRRTLSSEVCKFAPFVGGLKGSGSKKGLLAISKQGQIVRWNHRDADCPNTIVVGSSGSGKSFFTQSWVESFLREGQGRVCILDMGRSYKNLAQQCGGKFLLFRRDSSLCLNPFAGCGKQQKEEEGDILITLMGALKTMFGLQDEKERWTQWKINMLKSDVFEILRKAKDPSLELLYQALEQRWSNCRNADERQVMQELLDALKNMLKEGCYGNYFFGKTMLELDKPLTVIEMEELGGDPFLQSIVLQAVCSEITKRVLIGNRREPFLFLLDEAWHLLKNPSMAEFLFGFARRVRKCGGALAIVTQQIEDVEHISGLFDNSNNIIFLGKQGGAASWLKKNKQSDIFGVAGLEHLDTMRGASLDHSYVSFWDKNKKTFIPCLFVADRISMYTYDTRPQACAALDFLQEECKLPASQAINLLAQNSQSYEAVLNSKDFNKIRDYLLQLLGRKSKIVSFEAAHA